MNRAAHFHLPGPFEFYDFYKAFLPLFYSHREYFYEGFEIASLYGAPNDCLWSGGRVERSEANLRDVLNLSEEYGISVRLTFSNSLLNASHLSDGKCNRLCETLSKSAVPCGVIVHSELLTQYLRERYPKLYLVSSTTKVLSDFELLKSELMRSEFRYVVPDFRLNKAFDKLNTLDPALKSKAEFLCNECCSISCAERKRCYESVSRMNLGLSDAEHFCHSPNAREGYRFSRAMESPAFISVQDIANAYLPMGFTEFKIEGRSLGSALILEFLLYYLTKPEYHLRVREEIYLSNTLDLF